MTGTMFKTFRNIIYAIILLLAIGDLLSTYVFQVKLHNKTTVRVVLPDKTKELARKPPRTIYDQHFLEISRLKAYLYSAIWRSGREMKQMNGTRRSNGSVLVINGWKFRTTLRQFTCCFLLANKKVISRKSTAMNQWNGLLLRNIIQAVQFHCHTDMEPYSIKGVTITIYNRKCPNSKHVLQYLKPTLLPPISKTDKKIAVCLKLSYGSLDAVKLVEWIEAHRLLGVDHILAYTYKLNAAAMKVFKHYQHIGIVQLRDFGLPESAVEREVGTKNHQAWHDEQVVVMDCQERLQNYKYVALVDTDEYILPCNVKEFKNSWRVFLDRKFGRRHAGMQTYTKVHLLHWKPANPSHPLFIGKYSNTTGPMFDRPKGIYMPDRVNLGDVNTHKYTLKEGYRKLQPPPEQVLLHHFRGCRNEWLPINATDAKNNKNTQPVALHPPNNTVLFHKKNETKCYDFVQYEDSAMSSLVDQITETVLNVSRAIGVV